MANGRTWCQSMNGIAIYMEGGGQKANTKAELRRGMDEFLQPIKSMFRERNWHWKLVLCGGRKETFSKFVAALNSQSNKHHIVILLVDSEGQVNGEPYEHLTEQDGWNINRELCDLIHLMVQTMETWIVADQEALSNFYGSGFARNVLPQQHNIEEVPKAKVARSLYLATRNSVKGEYHKIRHASKLLGKMQPEIVRDKCPHCNRLFTVLENIVLDR